MRKLTQYFSGKRRTSLIALVTLLALLVTTGVVSNLEVRLAPADNSTFAQGNSGGKSIGAITTGGQTDQTGNSDQADQGHQQLPPVGGGVSDPPPHPGPPDPPKPPETKVNIEADTT